MKKLNFTNVLDILSKKERKDLLFFAAGRVLANGLDLIGLAGVAALASAFGSFTGDSAQAGKIRLPLIGEALIREREALIIATTVAFIFVAKSSISFLLTLKISLLVAQIESRFSNSIARDYFEVSEFSKAEKSSVSNFQSVVMSSMSGFRGYLNSIILFISEGSLLIFVIIFFVLVNPAATFALVAFMGFVLFVLNRIINKRIKTNGTEQIVGSQLSLQSAKNLHGINREARTSGVIGFWLDKFSEGRSKLANAMAINYTLNSLPRFVIETSLILGIFIFIGGVVWFSDIPTQAVTIGVFMAGGLRIVASMIPFQGAVTGMRSGAATGEVAFDWLQKILYRQDELLKFPSQQLDLETLIFENVHFSYSEAAEEVLRGVSFKIKPLTKVAIVGPSGAGKSTIFDLAMGFLVPDQGTVTYGNYSARNVLTEHPGTFAVVPQRPNLVAGSLLENVSLEGHNETDKKRAKDSLIRAGLEKLTISESWSELRINPDSGDLSGGEIQRLSLARALYRQPRILFLDEATSSLDVETELEITKVLDKLKNEVTIVLIAHRLSTVKQADNIIYLDDGQIVSQGTFQQMILNVKKFANSIELFGLK